MKKNHNISFLFSTLGNLSGIALIVLALTSNAYAEFYDVKIKKIASKSDTGDVVIQIKPGKEEDRFSGKARAMLLGTDPGTNKSLAVLLTAVSLGTEITIEVNDTPTFDIIQVITSTGLVAP